MYANKLIVGLAFLGMLLASTVPRKVAAQDAFTNRAVKPATGVDVPRTVPRSILSGKLLAVLFDDVNLFTTPHLDVDLLLHEDSLEEKFGPLRMGVVQELPVVRLGDFRLTTLDDGGRLWTASFRADGAEAVRLRMQPWSLPPGAEVIIFNPQNPGESAGPFTDAYSTSTGCFWTPTIYAEEVFVEIYLPADGDRPSLESGLAIDALLNQYRSIVEERSKLLDCHLDVNCPEYSEWHSDADGIGIVSFIDNQYGFFCSGSMFTRDPKDYTPLFTTARHCGIRDDNVESMLVTWFYESTHCDGPGVNVTTLDQTMGLAVLAQHSWGDYTLVGLRPDVPAGVAFLGWSSAWFGVDKKAVGIHHPEGSHKRISIGRRKYNPDYDNCENGACIRCYEVRFYHGNGRLEHGSSGSPVFDSDHRVRGIASCVREITCKDDQKAYYGRLSNAFVSLRPYLLPSDPIYVNAAWHGDEEGTVTKPFNRIIEGIFAVRERSHLYIEGGSYPGPLRITKSMTLQSRNGEAVIGGH